LLPVTQVGGDFVRSHLATRLGVSGSEAGAAAVVDLTLGLVTQILYTLIGLALLVQSGSPGAAEGRLVLTLLFGLLAAALALTAFYRVQRLAPFQKLAAAFRVLVRGRVWKSLAGDAADLDRNISTLYGRRGDVILSAGWRLATWLLHTGETWLALYFLGVPVGLAQALILESLSSAVRSAAFAVPGGLGIQEGGFVLLGGRLGLRPEIALALALVKRVREILVGAPALIAWAMAERRSLAGLLPRGAPRGARNGRP
jgi:putative membrane protein